MPAWTDKGDNTPVGNPIDRDFYGAIMMVMAGSLLVFLRRNLGVRLLVRRRFVIAGVLLIGFSYIEHPFDQWLSRFAIAVVILVFIHRARHMWRIKRGVPEWHSYDTGQSLIFSFLPLPRFFILGIIEPLLAGALGWWLSQRSDSTFYLGWWLIISAGFLFNLENTIRVARRESLFDMGDAFVESEHFARRANQFTQQSPRSSSSARQNRPNLLWGALLRAFWEALHTAQQSRRAQQEANGRRQHRQEEAEPADEQQEREAQQPWVDPTAGRMSAEQALEILELKPGATGQDIRAAYNRLMQKVHPDTGGSTFFAKQLNLARDTLLRPQRKAR